MSTCVNNKNLNPMILDEEMNLKDVFSTLNYYKRSIVIITLIVTLLAGLYTHFSTNIYQAYLTLQIQSSSSAKSRKSQNDFMATALDSQGENIDNEISTLQSYFIAQKALEKVDIGTRYYSTHNFKTLELYRDTPFLVKSDGTIKRLIGQKFKLYPIDETYFKLTVEPTFGSRIINKIRSSIGTIPENEKPVYFSGIFAYNTPISNSFFRITISKVGQMLNSEYVFTITPNKYMFGLVQKSLNVSAVSQKGSILRLSYKDNIPERAKIILNAIADVYKEESIEAKNSNAKKTLTFIDQQLIEINGALQNSAINLKKFKSNNIVINPQEKGIMISKKLIELEMQYSEIKIQESILQNLLVFINKNKDFIGIDTGSMNTVSRPILSLIQKIQSTDDQRSLLMVTYTDIHIEVIKINELLRKLKENLKATIKSNLRAMQQRKVTIKQIITRQSAMLKAIPAQEMELSQLSNSFSVNQKIYEYLLQKRAETAIIESSTVSTVHMIDTALVGNIPIKPKRLLNVLFGLIIGLIAGIAQAFMRNYLANTIRTINDLERHTALPLYSVLPLFGERKSLYEDALRVLLTKLEFSLREPKPKVITITSSIQGEGRTTTAIELACVMGDSGKKVIILDLDLRGSKIHTRLDIDNSIGMSALLTGESTLENVIKHIAPNTDIIVSGSVPSNPYDLIMSDSFKILLETMREQYDYVVILSPPAGLVADALVLMQMSDLNLIVFKAGYSKKDFLENTNRFVQEHNLENVRMILNGLELKKIRPWLRK